MDHWKKHDWIIMGSSGFWEIMNYHSKGTVEKIKDKKFHEIYMKAKSKNPKTPKTYENKDVALKEVIKNLLLDGIGRWPPYTPDPKSLPSTPYNRMPTSSPAN